MTQYNSLTREQKLLAEIIIQLGNISEAINVLATKDAGVLQQQIAELEAEIEALNTQIAQSQSAYNVSTPDTLNDVVSTLGIQLPQ